MSVMWDDAHYVTNVTTAGSHAGAWVSLLSVVVPMMGHTPQYCTVHTVQFTHTGHRCRGEGDPRRMRQSQEPFPAPRLPLLGAAHLSSSLISISDQSGSQHLPEIVILQSAMPRMWQRRQVRSESQWVTNVCFVIWLLLTCVSQSVTIYGATSVSGVWPGDIIIVWEAVTSDQWGEAGNNQGNLRSRTEAQLMRECLVYSRHSSRSCHTLIQNRFLSCRVMWATFIKQTVDMHWDLFEPKRSEFMESKVELQFSNNHLLSPDLRVHETKSFNQKWQ